MPRYIDADALKDELELADFETDSRMFGGQTVLFEDSVFKIVGSAHTVSPDEVRGVGEWEHQELAPTNWTFCSVCGRHRSKKYKWYYCPNCGAKMEVSEDA